VDNPPSKIGVQLRVLDAKTGEQKVDSGLVEMTKYAQAGNPVVPVGLRVPVDQLAPGTYKLELTGRNEKGASASHTIEFQVL
jgi:hypothetical protein